MRQTHTNFQGSGCHHLFLMRQVVLAKRWLILASIRLLIRPVSLKMIHLALTSWKTVLDRLKSIQRADTPANYEFRHDVEDAVCKRARVEDWILNTASCCRRAGFSSKRLRRTQKRRAMVPRQSLRV